MVPNSFTIFHLVLNRVPAIVHEMCSPVLSPVLAMLYSKCLAESCFPSCWKSSSVAPVFKNDEERSDPGKYRTISLSKIFESFINDNLTKHLDITSFFSDLQYGFRASRSTILAVLGECIYNSLDAGGEPGAITIVISKAFDKV